MENNKIITTVKKKWNLPNNDEDDKLDKSEPGYKTYCDFSSNYRAWLETEDCSYLRPRTISGSSLHSDVNELDFLDTFQYLDLTEKGIYDYNRIGKTIRLKRNLYFGRVLNELKYIYLCFRKKNIYIDSLVFIDNSDKNKKIKSILKLIFLNELNLKNIHNDIKNKYVKYVGKLPTITTNNYKCSSNTKYCFLDDEINVF